MRHLPAAGQEEVVSRRLMLLVVLAGCGGEAPMPPMPPMPRVFTPDAVGDGAALIARAELSGI